MLSVIVFFLVYMQQEYVLKYLHIFNGMLLFLHKVVVWFLNYKRVFLI